MSQHAVEFTLNTLHLCLYIQHVNEYHAVHSLSLLSSVGRKTSTGQSAVMLCGWE